MKTADFVLKSTAIFTGEGEGTISGAVAISGKEILAVGADVDEYIGEQTTVCDFGDQLIMPGFIDAHEHCFEGAISMSEHQCTDIEASTSEEEAVEMMRKYAEAHPDEERIRGTGWFPANWGGAPLPTKHSLDKVFPDIPVYLQCADGHSMWLNSKALEEMQFTPETKFENGWLGIDENGELDGMVYEMDACFACTAVSLHFEKDVFKEIIGDFMKALAEKGVTAISSMSGEDCSPSVHDKFETLMEMDAEGTLTSRMFLYMNLFGKKSYDDVLEYQKHFASNHLSIGGLKGFVDGVTSTHTGLLLEPYADMPETCGEGVPTVPPEEINRCVTLGNRSGLPVRLHCDGEGAVRLALDAFEASVKENLGIGTFPFYNSVEHIETIHPTDIGRFDELGVIASMQPTHMVLDDNEKIERCGVERCRWEWATKSLIDSNAIIALGTDFPVVTFDPLPQIYAAVTRCDFEGNPTGVENGENITMAQALCAYTSGSAKAYNVYDKLGTLEPGKLADIVVLDRNLFDIEPLDILNAKVVMTMVDGQEIYRK